METLKDSLACIAIALLFWLTLAFFGLFLMGLWSWIEISTGLPTSATGLQVFGVLFIGGFFTFVGSIGMVKIVNELLKVKNV